MVKRINKNESMRQMRRSRRMNEGVPYPDPKFAETVENVEEYIDEIKRTISETEEDVLYYIDYIKDNLYRINKIDSSKRMELWKELYESLQYYKDAERNIRRALENIGSASNEIRAMLK